MRKPIVQSFFDEGTNTISHLIHDPKTRSAAVFDPVLNYEASSGRTDTKSADEIVDAVRRADLSVEYIIETHVHADHLSAAPYLKKRCGGKTLIGSHIDSVQKTFGPIFNAESSFKTNGTQFDQLAAPDETISLGELELRAIYTPGHTPACMSYLIGDALFVGDTLFMPDYGTARCDFPGGDAGTLYDSIQSLFELPGEIRVFLCHDYKAPGRDEFVFETTIRAQKNENIHIHKGVTREAFVAMRTARDAQLCMPALILPAVQVNMRAGQMPPSDDNGTTYLKIPLDRV